MHVLQKSIACSNGYSSTPQKNSIKNHYSINISNLSIQKCLRLQIETYKVNWSAESKLNTRENLRYKESQATSPTRSAAVRRQRSRSSHGARDQAVAKAAAKGDAKAEWNQRQTVSAAPAHRTQPVV